MRLQTPVQAVCLDWGGTLMSEDGPQDRPMAQWPVVQVLPGAAEALALLRGRLPLAIATNASISRRPQIEAALARAGLRAPFDHIFCFTEIGHRKDAAAFWQHVGEALSLPLSAIAMVGDSLEQDARGPRRHGVQGVWLRPAGAPVTTDVPQVDTLPEFARAVLEARPAPSSTRGMA
ncbi:MAG: HAD family hydrolase [Burkholderiales bacterium]|nr:HAD family hydrolase [Burkholderiales bacterium]